MNDDLIAIPEYDWPEREKINWKEGEFFPVYKKDYALTENEWMVFWYRYPGPSDREDVFYTTDPIFRTANTESLRNSLRVLEVEQKLGEKNE
jgi:hypothetical protein